MIVNAEVRYIAIIVLTKQYIFQFPFSFFFLFFFPAKISWWYILLRYVKTDE
jgi:hypothetical protein